MSGELFDPDRDEEPVLVRPKDVVTAQPEVPFPASDFERVFPDLADDTDLLATEGGDDIAWTHLDLACSRVSRQDDVRCPIGSHVHHLSRQDACPARFVPAIAPSSMYSGEFARRRGLLSLPRRSIAVASSKNRASDCGCQEIHALLQSVKTVSGHGISGMCRDRRSTGTLW
jgi:hypothetical protein